MAQVLKKSDVALVANKAKEAEVKSVDQQLEAAWKFSTHLKDNKVISWEDHYEQMGLLGDAEETRVKKPASSSGGGGSGGRGAAPARSNNR